MIIIMTIIIIRIIVISIRIIIIIRIISLFFLGGGLGPPVQRVASGDPEDPRCFDIVYSLSLSLSLSLSTYIYIYIYIYLLQDFLNYF